MHAADEQSRGHVVWILGQINATPNQQYWTVDFVVDPEKATKKIGKTAEKIIPALCRALDDPALSESAHHMLVAIRPVTTKGSLIKALRSRQAVAPRRLRERCANWARRPGLQFRHLSQRLADNDSAVQRAAASALLRVGVGSNLATRALAKAIAHEPDGCDPLNSDAACLLDYLTINHELEGATIDDTLTANLVPVLLRKLQSQDANASRDARTALIDLGFEPRRLTLYSRSSPTRHVPGLARLRKKRSWPLKRSAPRGGTA